MKRFLSIMLCVMMLVSVFSIGASAMVPTSYEVVTSPAVGKVDYINQSFSDVATDVEFTTVYSSLGAAATAADPIDGNNTVMQLTSTTAKGMLISETKGNVLTANDKKLTIEFKVYPVGQAETINVGLNMPALLAGWAGKTAKDSYYLIGYPNFNANAWNTVKVEVNVPDNYTVTNASFPDHGSGATAAVTVNGNVLTADTATPGRTPTAGKFGIQPNFSAGTGAATADDSLVYVGIGGYALEAPAEGRKVYLDDIKVYKPAVEAVTEDVAYSVYEGDVLYEDAETIVFDAAELGFNKTANVRPYDKNYTKDAGNDVIITFDARNTVSGYPLCFQISNGEANFKLNILPTATIGSDWYSYKIVTNSDGSTGFAKYTIYKKKTGTNNAYVQLGWTSEQLSHSASGSGNGKYIQIGYWKTNSTIDQYCPTTTEQAAATEWEVKNIQMVKAANGGIVTGEAKAKGDGTADVKVFYTAKPGATTPIVAVYNSSNQLVDIAYAAAAAQSEGEFEANVVYAAGNTVKLYIWDGIATGVPALSNVVPITVQ